MTTAAFVSELEQILKVPKGALRMEDGPKTLKAWDSMAVVTILATVDQLGVELSYDSITEAQTVGQLLEVLKSNGALQD